MKFFLEDIKQIRLNKYRGLPHYGKNINIVFIGGMERSTYAANFLEVEIFNPLRLFSSEWIDNILDLRENIKIDMKGCVGRVLHLFKKTVNVSWADDTFVDVGRCTRQPIYVSFCEGILCFSINYLSLLEVWKLSYMFLLLFEYWTTCFWLSVVKRF